MLLATKGPVYFSVSFSTDCLKIEVETVKKITL